MSMNLFYKCMDVCLCSALFLFAFFPAAFADTLYLKNGRSLEGIIKKQTSTQIELDVGFGSVTFEKSAIVQMYMSTPEEFAKIKEKWQIDKVKSELMRERAEEERNKEIALWKQRHSKELEDEEFNPKEIAAAKNSGHMMVEALLNKKVNVTLMVDTGASLIVLTRKTARNLGIDLNTEGADVEMQVADSRKIKAKFVVLETVSIKDAMAEKVEAAVLLDNNVDYGFRDGLLGMSFLKRFNFKFDYNKGILVLEKIRSS
jgi:clan AA aspartic protease (TIGR02281 family)